MVFDVVVIGAGMAGLAAARVCAEAGLSVGVLEARERVGGRILTRRVGDEVIELGAEFVHGRPEELFALIEEAGLTTYERTGDFLRVGDGGLEKLEDDDDAEAAEGLKGYAGPDCSFMDWISRQGLSEEEKAAEVGYVEGFNAADAREASAVALGRQQSAEDAIDGERSWRVVEGYDRVPEFLAERVRAAGGVIEFGRTVDEVEWSGGSSHVSEARHGAPGSVVVRCRGGGEQRAGKVVVAVPLKVLEELRFKPEPVRMTDAIRRMRMGEARRFTMVFGKRLWPERMSFLLAREHIPQVWWTAHPRESHSLTGWVGGPRAKEFVGMDEVRLKAVAVEAAAGALGRAVDEVKAELKSFYTYDWSSDDAARGAYSYVAVGGAEASAEMSEPVEGRLFFAGEHTDTTGHWGTVHAALRSGLRAGRQVLEAHAVDG